jgi:hypothetical protein
VLRIIKGWPIQVLIISGYIGVVVMTMFAPEEIIGIAYDSGGVTTSTITVPLVTALGVGLASVIKGRHPMIDGFGLIAFASLTPMMFVMGFGMLMAGDAAQPMAAAAAIAAEAEEFAGGLLALFIDTFIATVGDVLPIAGILIGAQVLILRRRMPHLPQLAIGFGMVLLGLAFFLIGLELALFELGEAMAEQLTAPAFLGLEQGAGETAPDWTNYLWVYLAEPSLIAVAIKANQVSAGAIGTLGLRVAVAIGVAVGISLGSYRIVTGTPLHWYIVAGYVVVIFQTLYAPKSIIALAYDSGGVTTSTVTVPLVTALGLGLSSNIPGRNPMLDGFGLIAFASLFPIMAVMGYAQLGEWYTHYKHKRFERSERR